MTPPLRFVVAVVGGWGCLRAAFLIPAAPDPPPLPADRMEIARPASVAEATHEVHIRPLPVVAASVAQIANAKRASTTSSASPRTAK